MFLSKHLHLHFLFHFRLFIINTLKLKFIIVIKFIVIDIEMTESSNGNCFICFYFVKLIVDDFNFISIFLRHLV
jgi:hypothetical protein